MSKPRVYRTEGLVLKAFDVGEADRILTLYTPHSGKLRVVAKGVRRTRSRMSGHLDLFTRSNVLVASARQLDIVTQADTVENFRPLRDDLWRLSYCHYVAELVDSFGSEALANYPLYKLAIATLRRLSTASDLPLVVRAFELQLLGMTGYRPQLHRCLHCDHTIEPGVNHFSSKMGGILCPGCRMADHASSTISVAALKLMRNLQTNEEAMLQLEGLDDTLHREVEKHLHEYIVYRLESRPRSFAFLERLRSEQAFANS
jgi:DNA repair protein RecO (recombination protein O)